MADLEFKPNSEAQRAFLAASETEVLFGGAAGPGKTLALVIDPMRYVGYTDYTAGVFRRTYPELEGSVMPYCQKYYPSAGGVYNDQKKLWRFPSGATIRLGFMQRMDDWQNYMGHEFAGLYWDEMTNLHWKQIEMMRFWNRSRALGVGAYMRGATNPGGVSHVQVRQYFVDTCPAVPDGPQVFSEEGRMWWQPMKAGPTYTSTDPTTGLKSTRRFIPARLFDNKELLRNNPTYLAALMSQPEHRKRAYLEGDWNVFEGQFFSMWRPEIHRIRPMMPESGWAVRGCIDYGQRTALEIQCRDYEGNIINFLEVSSEHETPSDRFNDMADVLLDKGLLGISILYDTNMDINLKHYYGTDKTPAQIAKDVFDQKMAKGKPRLQVVSKASEDRRGYRVACNEAFKEFLSWKADASGKIVQMPKFYVTENCRNLLAEIPEFVHDESSPDGLDFDQEGMKDDHYDSAKMCLMSLRNPYRAKETVYRPRKTLADMSTEEYLTAEVFERRLKKATQKKTKADVI